MTLRASFVGRREKATEKDPRGEAAYGCVAVGHLGLGYHHDDRFMC